MSIQAALVVGCGYLGLRVARRWRATGREVYAVTRRPERAAELVAEGLRPVVADVTVAPSLADLPPAETVLYAVGRDRQTRASAQAVYVEGLLAVLDRLAAHHPPPRRVLLVSSTGVYGDAAGMWVNESSPCLAQGEAARALLAAEAALQAHRLGRQAIVLRLAGLYGPGRLPKLADLLVGNPLPVDPEAVLNLIHVEDAARAVLAAEAHGQAPGVYNIADGHPVVRRQFYQYLAELLGCPAPMFAPAPAEGAGRVAAPHPREESAAAPPAAGRDRSGTKRVDNRRMLHELGVRLAYPTWRQGLASIAAELRAGGQAPG